MALKKSDLNKFKKRLEDIVADDLEVLKETAEGWYVEYKRELVRARAIAKSVTSFANQYGGWLFIGVDENEERKAGTFPGVLVSESSSLTWRFAASNRARCSATSSSS